MAKQKTDDKKKSKKKVNTEYYSKILINKHRRSALILMVPSFSLLFTIILFGYLMRGESWQIIAGPILIIGLVLMLFPSTEEWDYTPWQSSAQQYERHFNERK